MADTFNELLNEDSIALLGGIAFFESDIKVIMPSCYCGLEQFVEVDHYIRNKQSPWLGHDPFPQITYYDDMARVWSDSPQEDGNLELYYIDYKYEELLVSLNNSRKDLEDFIDIPLYNWIYSRDKDVAIKFQLKMHEWLLADRNE